MLRPAQENVRDARATVPWIAAQEDPGVKWSVYLLKKKRQWIGTVTADSEKEALKKARELPEIPERDKFRVVVVRE